MTARALVNITNAKVKYDRKGYLNIGSQKMVC